MADFEHLERRLVGVARKLTPDIHLQQDILQEMRLKIWKSQTGHTDSYYLEMGLNAGKRYMERFIDPHLEYRGSLDEIQEIEEL